jgi:diguanylate cyclase (GGDEF)-like protein
MVTERALGAKLEQEFVRTRLLEGRALIRAACVLGVLLVAFRILDLAATDRLTSPQLWQLALVFAASVTLAVTAFTPAFTRLYLPLAHVIVPARNATAAIAIARAASLGELELLMFMPFMVLGPFFFLGLGFRAALCTVALTVATFIASVFIFDLAVPVAARSSLLLILATAGCAIGARQLERWSLASFVQGRLIAEMAQHDALTGTKNRRVFDEHLGRLWQQATEDRRTLAILLLDVDHFKSYNDHYGHQAGDHALRRVAETLQGFVSRPLDLLARYGGEEFAAILYDVDAQEANEVADRMRRAVSALGVEHEESRHSATLTISAGVAVIHPTSGRKPRGALQLADEALYEAKTRGRNRIELRDEADHLMLVTGIFSRKSFASGT